MFKLLFECFIGKFFFANRQRTSLSSLKSDCEHIGQKYCPNYYTKRFVYKIQTLRGKVVAGP